VFDDGGEIIAFGSPEELAEHPASHTGKFLKKILSKSSINDSVNLVKAS
jgi:excinuclease ABC subunit A